MINTCSSLDLNFRSTLVVKRLERYRDIFQLPSNQKFSIQGAGISIAACNMAENIPIINMKSFDRIISFSAEEQYIEAESGTSLEKLNSFLMPKGFMISVLPGYPAITLGGCIAGHVHGKNHYKDGSFSRHVISLQLYHPKYGEIINLSKTQEPDLFELTCGGFGLTGIILTAKIRIQPIHGNCVEVNHYPADNIQGAIEKLDNMKGNHDFLYSWHDLARFDDKMGVGYIVTGNFIKKSNPPLFQEGAFKIDTSRRRKQLPIFNYITLPFINRFYYHLTRKLKSKILHTNNALFPWITKAWYFSCFSNKGLLELQMLVPFTKIQYYLQDFQSILLKHRYPFAVASLKIFRGQQSLLRYDGSGISFSIQMPYSTKGLSLMNDVDMLNIQHGAIMSLIKDSRLSDKVASQLYPEFEEFYKRLHLFDPGRQFMSDLSQRLAL